MIALATIAFNRPLLIAEQIRLLDAYLLDDYELDVWDNSTDEQAAEDIRGIVLERTERTVYVRPGCRMHHETLNRAAAELRRKAVEHIGFLDHDVFPTKPTRLAPLIEPAGFYGVGQRHPATGRLYLWPGFCFFSLGWLGERPLDFSGLRDGDPRNDGDTGSGLWPLFAEEDWSKLFRVDPYGYRPIRAPDDYGVQSWAVEVLGDWIHLSNGSGWMTVPRPEERERLVHEMLAEL